MARYLWQTLSVLLECWVLSFVRAMMLVRCAVEASWQHMQQAQYMQHLQHMP